MNKVVKKRKLENIKKSGCYIKNDGADIWYRYDNKKCSTVNVMIHGLGGSSYPLEKFSKYFNENGKSTLLIDLRGHGFSTKPSNDDYDISSYSSDILAILDKEDIKNVNLIGHCFGGMISMDIIRKDPEIVKALTLVSTNHKPDNDIKLIATKEILGGLDELLSHLAPVLYHSKRDLEIDYAIFNKESDYYIPRMIKDFEDTSIETMFKTLESIFKADYEETLRGINAPTLIVHGKKDSVFSYKVAEKMSEIINPSKLKIREEDNHVSHIIDKETNLPIEIYSFIYS